MDTPTPAGSPVVGEILPSDYFGPGDDFHNILEVLGFEVTRTAAIVSLGALLFFFGVALSCITNLNKQTPCWKVFACSIPIFLLSSAIWIPLLESKSIGIPMPLLDAFIQWTRGSGPISSSFVALGLVIVLGMFSWRIFLWTHTFGSFMANELLRRAKAFVFSDASQDGKATSEDDSRTSCRAQKCPDNP